MSTPPYDDLVEAVRREGGALLAAIRDRLDAPVPTCGDWDAARLLGHVGRVYRSVGRIVGERLQQAPAGKPATAGDDVVGYYAEALDLVVEALGGALPHEPVWNWAANRPAAVTFWARRMAHESIVHRADAEIAATGRTTAGRVDPALAADGVDEFLEVMLPRRQRRAPAARLTGTAHLHARDDGLAPGQGEWVLTLTPTSCDVHRGHRHADLAVAGPAYALMMTLYNRPAAVDVHGDERLLEAWRAAVTV